MRECYRVLSISTGKCLFAGSWVQCWKYCQRHGNAGIRIVS